MPDASPALTGLPSVYGADIYDDNANSQFPLGAIGYGYGGNKVFRYGNAAGTNLDVGKLAVAADITANHANQNPNAAAVADALVVDMSVGATAVTVDIYTDGELVAHNDAGEGTSYHISGNVAISSSGNGNIFLFDPIITALATTSDLSLIENNWQNIVISGTDQGNMPCGVPNVAITLDQFGWFQTRGMCAVLADETLAVGSALTIGTGVAGAVEVKDGAGEFVIGVAQQAGVDAEYRGVFLTID